MAMPGISSPNSMHNLTSLIIFYSIECTFWCSCFKRRSMTYKIKHHFCRIWFSYSEWTSRRILNPWTLMAGYFCFFLCVNKPQTKEFTQTRHNQKFSVVASRGLLAHLQQSIRYIRKNSKSMLLSDPQHFSSQQNSPNSANLQSSWKCA